MLFNKCHFGACYFINDTYILFNGTYILTVMVHIFFVNLILLTKNLHTPQSAATPISGHIKYLSKFFPQKMHFRNCSLKKYILEIVPSKNTFRKLLPQKIHYKICFLKTLYLFFIRIIIRRKSLNMLVRLIFIQFQYCQTLKFLYPFLCFIMFCFFRSNQHFASIF